MTKKENLHALIKSLSKAEKRYFKLFTDSGGSSNYMELFDCIDGMEDYDEEYIKNKFAGENFVKQLHVTKNYLIKQILKALRNYHSKISKTAEVSDILRNVEILFGKDLYDLCKYELARAGKLAAKYDDLIGLIEISIWKRKLLLAVSNTFQAKREVNEILETTSRYIEHLKKHNDYWLLIVNMFERYDTTKEKPADIVNRYPLKKLEDDEPLQSKVLYYHLKYMLQVVSNNLTEAEKPIDDIITLLEANPERVKNDPSSYITSLNNKVGLYLAAKRHDEITPLLNKIREVPAKYGIDVENRVTLKTMLRSYNVELELYRDMNDYQKGKALIAEVDEFINKHSAVVSKEYFVLFYYQFAHIYFMEKEYTKALNRTNELMQPAYAPYREDIQSYARFLNLIIHYELGNIYVLKYAVESCRRFLKNKRKLFDFEKVLLNFFAKASVSIPEKHGELFIKLNETLFAKTDEKTRAEVLDYLNFEKWIDSRLKFVR